MSEANKYAPSQAALDTRDAAVPPEVDRWNWGAFLLSWIWGIGNNTFIAFLTFVPFVGIVMPFVLGAKGSAWAWRTSRRPNRSANGSCRTPCWKTRTAGGASISWIELLLA
jgi:hypothetical protein